MIRPRRVNIVLKLWSLMHFSDVGALRRVRTTSWRWTIGRSSGTGEHSFGVRFNNLSVQFVDPRKKNAWWRRLAWRWYPDQFVEVVKLWLEVVINKIFCGDLCESRIFKVPRNTWTISPYNSSYKFHCCLIQQWYQYKKKSLSWELYRIEVYHKFIVWKNLGKNHTVQNFNLFKADMHPL